MAERIAKLVDAKDTSAHAFMLEAIKEKLDAEEAQAAFRTEAERRLAGMKKTGKAIPADEVFDYLRARVRGEKAKRPRARKLGQIESIRTAIMILNQHPRIGRPVPDSEIRELVISVGETGFIALYQYDELDDLVRILAVRHQREAGYRGR